MGLESDHPGFVIRATSIWIELKCLVGTGFMERLERGLQEYVTSRLEEDSRWSGLRVIISGHSVPGEGEHKALEFIRQQRTLPGW